MARDIPRVQNGLLKLILKAIAEELDGEEDAATTGTPLSAQNPAINYAERVGAIRAYRRAMEILAEVETKAIEETRRA